MAVSVESFDRIVRFILERGDRLTWCNRFNTNPHYAFSNFDAFLNPDVGQKNINCDPALSGFDNLTIRVDGDGYEYFEVTRKKDRVVCEPPGAAHYVGRILSELDAAG